MRASRLCVEALRSLSLHEFIEPRTHIPCGGPNLGHHCVLTSNSHNIFENLAAEEALLRGTILSKAQTILFMYVNEPCVVVGRNQNVVEEVALRRAFREGVAVARRSSGGGAVYHDMGNLCFSFFTHRADYAPEKTIQLLRLGLCAQYGVDPARLTSSRRHDLYLDGKKITGSAMRVQRDIACHHCTLLIDSDRERLGRFLRSEADLIACTSPAVGSVRSAVTTLEREGVLPPVPLNPTTVMTTHARVHALAQSVGRFFLAHVDTIMRHPSPWEIRPQTLHPSEDADTCVLDVRGAASSAVTNSTPYGMLYGEGRAPSPTDSKTLMEEVSRMRTRDWLLAMPRYSSHTEITRDDMSKWLRAHPRWKEVVRVCGLAAEDVADELVLGLLDTHDALHIRATLDHRKVVELRTGLGPSLTSALGAPDAKVDETWKGVSVPLPWLDAFFQVAVVDEHADAPLILAAESPLLSGFRLEAREAFLTKLDVPSNAVDLCCEVLLSQIFSCWQHKNVLDF